MIAPYWGPCSIQKGVLSVKRSHYFALLPLLLMVCGRASAQSPRPLLITVDEFGHGSIQSSLENVPLLGTLGPDLFGPGGLPSVMKYPLSLAVVSGDVE